ncbi:MAG: hypothetical protein P1V36_04550 [Planctomycetota bacterium]|nr:hypothetical protein [Planctomycetota bacterium]
MPKSRSHDAEIQALEGEIRTANSILLWAPWMGLSVFAAIPVGNAYGSMAGWIALLSILACTGIVIYMPVMRRHEYRQRIRDLREKQG